jgi:hypothetical protein
MINWFTPTMDPVEIDKRITELKTVQFWLEQNSKAIASTIQTLEVQKMTLSTLKSMNVDVNKNLPDMNQANEAWGQLFTQFQNMMQMVQPSGNPADTNETTDTTKGKKETKTKPASTRKK